MPPVEPSPHQEIPRPPSLTLMSRLNGHMAPVTCLATSPDGETIVSGDASGELRAWHANDQRLIGNWQVASGPLWAAHLIDGTHCCVASPAGEVVVYRLGQEIVEEYRQLAHPSGITSIQTTRVNGQLMALTSGKDTAPALWDLTDRRLIRRLTGHRDRVAAIALSPDARTAITASWDGGVRVWCMDSRDLLASTTQSDSKWMAIHVDWDNAVAWLGSSKGHLARWDWRGDQLVLSERAVHEGPVSAILMSHGMGPSPHVVTVGADKKAMGSDLGNTRAPNPLADLERPATLAASGPDGVICLAGYRPEVALYRPC